jgi:hypothetical protein
MKPRTTATLNASTNFHEHFSIKRFFVQQIFQAPWTPSSPKYEFEIIEESPINSILTTLHATDADSTISEYQLVDGGDDSGSEFFEINNVTGKEKSFLGFNCSPRGWKMDRNDDKPRDLLNNSQLANVNDGNRAIQLGWDAKAFGD